MQCRFFTYPKIHLVSQGRYILGSFDWEFNYKRLPLTADDLKNPTRPFKSPVMAGGYFAISRKWFWELGGYDEGLDIWGGEQYELSFKVLIPCSLLLFPIREPLMFNQLSRIQWGCS